MKRIHKHLSIQILLLTLFVFAANAQSNDSDNFRSRQNGDWTTGATWERWDGSDWVNDGTFPGGTPTTTRDILISHDVTRGSNFSINNSTITIAVGGTLEATTANSGLILGSTSSIAVFGALIRTGDFTINAGGVVSINDGGVFKWDRSNAASTIPTMTWQPGSTIEINGGSSTSGTIGGVNQTFHHFVVNGTSSWNGSLNCVGELTTINGDFIIRSTGGGTREFRLAGNNSYELNIGGDLIIEGGILNVSSGATGTKTVNIGGDYIQTGGRFRLTSGSATVNFTGANSEFNQTSGDFWTTDIDFNVKEDAKLTLKSDFDFSSATSNRNFVVESNATLDCGTYFLDGGTNNNFTLDSGATLITAHADGITTSGATGSIRVTGTRTYDSDANYVYNANGAQVTGNGLTGANNLTAGSQTQLTVSNAATVANLRLESGASLLDNGNLTHTGSFFMERVIDDGGFAWHFLSAPVSGMTIIGSDFVPDDTPLPTNFDFFAFDQSAALPWINIRGEGGTPNAAFETNFVPGKGYLVAYADDYGTTTFTFTGTMQTGVIDYTLAYTAEHNWSGWNLLGNPYPSAIDWNKADRNAFEDNFAYVYDRTFGEGAGGYRPIDGTNPDAIIPANQGFFVRAKSGSNNEDFTFTNDMRVHGGDFYKNQTLAGDLLKLRLANEYYDETTIRVMEGSGFERDRTDALKLFSFAPYAPQLYTFTSNHVMVAVNSIPKIEEDRQIRLGVRIPEDGEYTLSVQELGAIFSDGPLYLLDNATGIKHKLNETPEYVFTASAGTYNQRFRISFKNYDDDDSVNITDPGQQTKIRIWQHNNSLHVDNPDTALNLYLYDISGRQIKQFDAPAGQHRFELKLPAGAYFVKSSGECQHETVKIIIQ